MRMSEAFNDGSDLKSITEMFKNELSSYQIKRHMKPLIKKKKDDEQLERKEKAMADRKEYETYLKNNKTKLRDLISQLSQSTDEELRFMYVEKIEELKKKNKKLNNSIHSCDKVINYVEVNHTNPKLLCLTPPTCEIEPPTIPYTTEVDKKYFEKRTEQLKEKQEYLTRIKEINKRLNTLSQRKGKKSISIKDQISRLYEEREEMYQKIKQCNEIIDYIDLKEYNLTQ